MPVDPTPDIQNLVSRALRWQVSLSEFSQPLYIEEAQAIDDLEPVKGHAAIFVDPRASESYRVHFFEVQIVSEEPIADTRQDGAAGESRTQILYATLAAVLDGPGGKELAPADLLHDLTPLPENETVEVEMDAPDPQAIVALEQWIRIKVQFPLKQQQAKERQRLLQIRREYVSKMFAE